MIDLVVSTPRLAHRPLCGEKWSGQSKLEKLDDDRSEESERSETRTGLKRGGNEASGLDVSNYLDSKPPPTQVPGRPVVESSVDKHL